jgi:hypothetical protein
MNEAPEQFSMLDPRNQTQRDLEYAQAMEGYFASSLGTTMDKLRNFTKFVPRQALSRFLAKHTMVQQVLEVHGHIVECGVFLGGGLTTWAQLSAIYEPFNHNRRVIGFDTFTGFVGVHDKDKGDNLECATAGGYAAPAYDDLQQCLALYNLNRPIGHIPRVELVAGDACQTISGYLEKQPQTVVALLYLDFDLFEPTKMAIETFLPRMPKGAVIAFDELNHAAWPGESLAVLETIGIRNLRIRRFPFTPMLSYAVLE